MQTQYSVLGYRIGFYFHDYKLSIKVDENGHSYRNIEYEIKLQKAIEQELGCEFIRIVPDEEDFDIFKAIKKYLDTSNNCLIDKTSMNKVA